MTQLIPMTQPDLTIAEIEAANHVPQRLTT